MKGGLWEVVRGQDRKCQASDLHRFKPRLFSRVVGSGLGDVRDLRANQGC